MKRKKISLLLAGALLCAGMPGAYAERVTGTSFSNDFESYDTDYEWLTVYNDSKAGDTAKSYVMYYATGCGSMSAKFLKPGETTPYTEGMYTTDADGITRPKEGSITTGNGNYFYKNMNPEITGADTDKFVGGGLGDGYYGLSHKWGYPRIAGGSWEEANITDNGYDLCVVKDGENKVFRMSPATPGGHGNFSEYCMFGKADQQFAGKVNLVKADVKIAEESKADAFRLCITKDDTFITQKSQQNYGWMNYGTQFWKKSGASMYDAVMFKAGKVYLGPEFGKSDNMDMNTYICDYEVGKTYTIEYYLNLEDLNNPRHMVRIYDGTKLIGEKSAKIVLTENTTTTMNNSSFYTELKEDLPGNRPTGEVTFAKFTDSESYGVCMLETTAFNTAWMRGGAVVFIDNFSVGTAEMDQFVMNTAEDKYYKAPIGFSGEQSVEYVFNYGFIDNPAEVITITDAEGKPVNCTMTVDNNKVTITFADGALKAASNYYVSVQNANSAYGKLDSDKNMIIRTKDTVEVADGGTTFAGDTLTTNITNNSGSPWNVIVAVSVKKADLPVGGKVYFRPATVSANGTATVSLSGITKNEGDTIEVFYLDGFTSLRAFTKNVTVE